MRKTLFAAGLAIALGTGFTLDAAAQAKPETKVKQRQAAMTLQGKYFGPLAGMAQCRLSRGHYQVGLGQLHPRHR